MVKKKGGADVGVKKMKDSVVKISSELLTDVEEFINLNENKFKYVNRKQFINIAVMNYLQRMKNNGTYD